LRIDSAGVQTTTRFDQRCVHIRRPVGQPFVLMSPHCAAQSLQTAPWVSTAGTQDNDDTIKP